MLTENEVAQLLEIPEVKNVVQQLHHSFILEEPNLKSISVHDFFSGLLLSPSVALAQVDGTTSLFEELSLNKKARRFSKGGFLLQHDPVVKMIIHLQSSFTIWEQRFLTALHKIVSVVVPEISHDSTTPNGNGASDNSFMHSSYILVRLLETFFLPVGEEITNKRRVSNLEYQKISSIAEVLQLSSVGSFKNFIRTFEVK
ncbi:MAG: hypothetical protein DHS20C17_30740 [Cyclobacteriaceae bacterium]|nr:MAG: hypothetical protein DHS20C17_30740 [Cyclobacteriaceae bacterium]